VPRAAARGDAGGDGNAAAADAFLHQLVEVGGVRGFEFGEAAGLLRQAAQTVGDVHDDLGLVFDEKLASEGVNVHGGKAVGLAVGCRKKEWQGRFYR
jgi:hypothetical protein